MFPSTHHTANYIGLERFLDRSNISNYQTWSPCMEMILHQEEQWDHVDGSTTIPADPINQVAWGIKDSKVRTNLLLCMKDNQFVHAKSLTTSQEI